MSCWVSLCPFWECQSLRPQSVHLVGSRTCCIWKLSVQFCSFCQMVISIKEHALSNPPLSRICSLYVSFFSLGRDTDMFGAVAKGPQLLCSNCNPPTSREWHKCSKSTSVLTLPHWVLLRLSFCLQDSNPVPFSVPPQELNLSLWIFLNLIPSPYHLSWGLPRSLWQDSLLCLGCPLCQSHPLQLSLSGCSIPFPRLTFLTMLTHVLLPQAMDWIT